jgi:shikimate dehydrogenase
VYVRRPEAGEELRPAAHALGVPMTVETWGRAADVAAYDVVVSTVPKGGADALAVAAWAPPTVVFDVVYDPWPTALAAAAERAGCAVVSGLDLLCPRGAPVRAVHRRPRPAGRCARPSGTPPLPARS